MLLVALLALVVSVQPAANAFRAGEPVYLDPAAQRVDLDALRERIGALPIFIAVLPEGEEATVTALREATGRKGTYALALGDELRAYSDGFDAAAAIDEHPEDLQAALLAFIDATVAERERQSGGSAGAVLAAALLAAVVVGGAALILTRRRARR